MAERGGAVWGRTEGQNGSGRKIGARKVGGSGKGIGQGGGDVQIGRGQECVVQEWEHVRAE